MTRRRYLNIDISIDFGRKNTFVNAMYAMQHLCYECKTDRELILTKYVVSIAGLIDINKITKTEYVVSIAGLIDINKMADNKTHWGDLKANLTGTSCSRMRTGHLTGNIDNEGRKQLLYLSWLLG